MYISEIDQTHRHAYAGVLRRTTTLLQLLAMAVLVAHCGPPDADMSLREAPSSDEPVVTVASTTQMDVLNTTLPTQLAITRAYAVRAEDEAFGHFVAAKLRRPLDSLWDGQSLGVWYMPDGMDVPGAPYAVDSTARGFGSTPGYGAVGPAAIRAHAEIAALLDLTLARP